MKTLKSGFKVYYPLEKYSIGGTLYYMGKRVEDWKEVKPEKAFDFYPDSPGGKHRGPVRVWGDEIYETREESEAVRKGEDFDKIAVVSRELEKRFNRQLKYMKRYNIKGSRAMYLIIKDCRDARKKGIVIPAIDEYVKNQLEKAREGLEGYIKGETL